MQSNYRNMIAKMISPLLSWLQHFKRSSYCLPVVAIINVFLSVSIVLTSNNDGVVFPVVSMVLAAALTLALGSRPTERHGNSDA